MNNNLSINHPLKAEILELLISKEIL